METVFVKNINEALLDAVTRLEENQIEDARLNAELLMCDVLDYSRIDLYLNFNKPLNDVEIRKFESFVDSRIRREPLQYILGKTEFYGYEILLNKKVLIPRPETEILTEKVLEDILTSGKKYVSILEIGTGSGCIVIALAKELDKAGIDYKIVSIDNSEDALEIALRNCELNSIYMSKVRLILKDFFSIRTLKGNVDYIISNPPYISKEEYNLLQPEVKNYEPAHSLTDFSDGFSFYRKIFELAGNENFKGKILCEIGYDGKEKLLNLIETGKIGHMEFFKDLGGIDRIIKAEK
jgi:release factor glutamine methyltransferase